MPASTKDRILDAAERLFALHGFAATSLRAITAEAGANLAAVNYHFRSKDALLRAVFARRLQPVTRRRFELLDALEARAGAGPLEVEDVLHALLDPLIELARTTPGVLSFLRLFGRMFWEPSPAMAKVLRTQLGATKTRFIAALRRALPRLPEEELYWRVYFLMGGVASSMGGLHILELMSDGRCKPGDLEEVKEHLIGFMAAGFRSQARAPLPEARRAS